MSELNNNYNNDVNLQKSIQIPFSIILSESLDKDLNFKFDICHDFNNLHNYSDTNLSNTKHESKEIYNNNNKKSNIFVCNYLLCGKTFKYKWILERHINSHFCFKLFKCEYENCQKAYKSKENLSLHIKNKHLLIKPYKCGYCELIFSHRNGMIIYI